MTFEVVSIGAGAIANEHADRLAERDADIVAAADIDPDAREAFAAAYDCAGYEDYERMLEETDPDVALVAVPNRLHAECAVAALERDINAFIEKPMARTLEGAERIVAAEEASDAEAFVGFTMVFSPAFEAVAERVHDDEFGDVFEVDCTAVRRRGIPKLGGWFTQKAEAGGGALIDLGVHLLGVTVDLLEDPDVAAVSARTGDHFGRDPEGYTYLDMWAGEPREDPTFDVDDSVRALVRFDDGTTLALDVTWASNREPERRVQVLGDEAGATVPLDEGAPTVYGTDRDELTDTELQIKEHDAWGAEWDYFFDVLAGEREHATNTVQRGLTVQRIIDATYRSAESGGEVRLD
ncbi:MAG: Gfo/Idh/MocA family protein [Haloarculaceae archaeon]